jgi:uncharacterized membrane protein YphA (DoxX/SURF4 family)
MKKTLSNDYLLLLVRFLLGFIFIYAGIEKIIDPAGFAKSIINYKLLPLFFVNIFAITIPWIELIGGILLIFGIAARENSFIILLLLGIFIAAITVSLFRGLNIDCGCFGTLSGSKIGFQKILENIFLLFLGFHLMYFGEGRFSLQSLLKNDTGTASGSES